MKAGINDPVYVFCRILVAPSMKKFFQTSEGGLHRGRIAGVAFAVGLAVCLAEMPVMKMETVCWMRLVFTIGWWTIFGAKRCARTLSEMAHPMEITGAVLLVLGLAGQFYFALHR